MSICVPTFEIDPQRFSVFLNNWRGDNSLGCSLGIPIKQTRDQIGVVPTQRERDSLNSRAMNADKKSGSARPAEEEGPTTRQRNNRIHALCISDIRTPLSSKHKGSYFWLYADPNEKFPLQTKCRLVRQPLWHRPAAATGKSHSKIYGDILYPLSDFKYIIQRRKGERERERGLGKVVRETDSNPRYSQMAFPPLPFIINS